MIVGVVHGLAGSAAVALLVLPMIRNPYWVIFYLLIFGAGTIAVMMLITAIIRAPIMYSATRFQLFNRYIGTAGGALVCSLVCFSSMKSASWTVCFDRQFAREKFPEMSSRKLGR